MEVGGGDQKINFSKKFEHHVKHLDETHSMKACTNGLDVWFSSYTTFSVFSCWPKLIQTIKVNGHECENDHFTTFDLNVGIE